MGLCPIDTLTPAIGVWIPVFGVWIKLLIFIAFLILIKLTVTSHPYTLQNAQLIGMHEGEILTPIKK